jgi:hypothetical protein
LADDILGAESIDEYKAIFQKLGGPHTNYVFQALGIEAPPRAATLRRQAAEEKKLRREKAQGVKIAGGTSGTTHLESKKRKLGPKAGGPPKLSKAAKTLFASSPLKATRDSEDATNVEASPLAALPLTSVEPPSVHPKVSDSGSGRLAGLDVSDQEVECDKGAGGHIDVGLPTGGAGSHDVAVAETCLSPHKSLSGSRSSSRLSSSSGGSGKEASFAGDDDQENTMRARATAGRDSSSSSSKSNGYFIFHEDPVAAAAKLGASGANLIGGNKIGSLRFES